jgi:ABC-type nitrate/sulfonate/bicarbonate transport system substrate-binding protein
MTSRFIGLVSCLVLSLFQFSSIPPASAQLFKLKTSYSALTANMAAYWLAKDTKLFEKHGLDVDVVLIESGTTRSRHLSPARLKSPWEEGRWP